MELNIDRTFDARNRLNVISAAYFDVSSHQIADYDYTGPWRVRNKTLGETYSGTTPFENGTYLSTAYDGLRRITGYTWMNKDNDVLVGFGRFDRAPSTMVGARGMTLVGWRQLEE